MENKTYRFVKVKDISLNLEYEYMLYTESVYQLLEHTEKYMSTTIEEGIKDYFDIFKNGIPRHITTDWADAITKIQDINKDSLLNISTKLEKDVLNGKIKTLYTFGNLLLRPSGSYMFLDDRYEIIDEVIKSEMVYPQYTKNDIRIIQWEGGTHFYAKVGNMDVTDKYGNQKWDNEIDARYYANKFLNTL